MTPVFKIYMPRIRPESDWKPAQTVFPKLPKYEKYVDVNIDCLVKYFKVKHPKKWLNNKRLRKKLVKNPGNYLTEIAHNHLWCSYADLGISGAYHEDQYSWIDERQKEALAQIQAEEDKHIFKEVVND